MSRERLLVVIADDYGIGPATSRGILDVARRGLATGAVLLVNSPHAEAGVCDWRKANIPLELGWHPCLTLDHPILPESQVPSLVSEGCFRPLGSFMRRWFLGRLCPKEIEAELRAQYDRFQELVGHPPTVVNSHQHTQLFAPVGEILLRILREQRPKPYVRRIREPWQTLLRIPGAKLKRAFLSKLGKKDAKLQGDDFPGNDWLAGITDPPFVHDEKFLVRWLSHVPGRVVELACHPGHFDTTLVGRDSTGSDGLLQRRTDEYKLLTDPSFVEACSRANFKLAAPSALEAYPARGQIDAA